MTDFEDRERYGAGNVEPVAGSIMAYKKKNKQPVMHHMDYRLGLFRDAVDDVAEVKKAFIARRQLVGYEIGKRFFENGSHEGLHELDQPSPT